MHVGCWLGVLFIVIGAVAAWQALCKVVQALIGTSGGSAKAPRKAVAQRKKVVRVFRTRAAEDGPSKGDLLWARALYYLLRWAKPLVGWRPSAAVLEAAQRSHQGSDRQGGSDSGRWGVRWCSSFRSLVKMGGPSPQTRSLHGTRRCCAR